MPHIVVLGLVLTLVAGVVSFAVLVRKIHAKPSRLPQSIPTPLLLYNLWIAGWLVAQYLEFYLFPSIAQPVALRIGASLRCCLAVISLAWLRSHVVLVDQFLESRASRLVRRWVSWCAWVLMSLIAAGFGMWLVNAGGRSVVVIPFMVTDKLLFPFALAASILLAIEARQQRDEGVRRAMNALAYSYVVLFALLAVLSLVFWQYRIGSRAALLSVDLILELSYNVLTVVWVSYHADRFAREATSEAESARGFDALCESFGISPREREIIELICQGLTNREIANRLFISVGTVKDHNYTIFQKAGVRNRTKLAQVFTRPASDRAAARPAASAIRRVI